MRKLLFAGILLMLVLAVGAAADLEIVDADTSLSGTNGDDVGGTFVVNNTDATETLTNVDISDTHTFSIAYIPNNFDVSPLDDQEVGFTVSIPSDVKVGTYSGTISAIDEGNNFDSFNLNVEVLDNGGELSYSGGVVTSTSASGVTATDTFVLTNGRNADVEFTISGELTSGLETLNIEESSGTAIFLDDTTVEFQVDIPSDQAPLTYTGNLEVSYDGDAKKVFVPVSLTVTSTQAIDVDTYSNTVPLTINTQPGVTRSVSFILRNIGNIAVNNIEVAADTILQDNDGEIITLTFNPDSNIDLEAGDYQTIQVQADIPDEMDTGTYDTLVRLNDGTAETTFQLRIIIESVLKITDVDINSPGDDEELKPGEDFRISVDIENMADDIDIQDIEVDIYFLVGSRRWEDDDEEDIEDTSDEFDLDAGEDDTIHFEFTTPYAAQHGDDITVMVEVSGKNADDSKIRYYDTDDSLNLDIVRERHELLLERFELDTTTVKCERRTNLRFEIRNIGRDQEEDIRLQVSNSALGLNYFTTFDLSEDYDDDDNSFSKTLPIVVDDDQKKGAYPIRLVVEYDEGQESFDAELILNVEDCPVTEPTEPTTPEEGETGGETIIIVPPTDEEDLTVAKPVAESKSTGFTDTGLYIGLLIILVVILLAAVMVLFSKLSKR